MKSILIQYYLRIRKQTLLVKAAVLTWLRNVRREIYTQRYRDKATGKVNLCCGWQKIPGYIGIDSIRAVDIRLDLALNDLPFKENTHDAVVCMSAINYFTRARALEIIAEVKRILKPGGVARFGVQDLAWLAERYVKKDREFFFQKLPDGRERFEGTTLGDKFASWFYGYATEGSVCKYFYDYESLAYLFHMAGFAIVERKTYRESRLENIDMIDNRPDQMFYLEAVK